MIIKTGDIYRNTTNDVLCYVTEGNSRGNRYSMEWRNDDGSYTKGTYDYESVVRWLSNGTLDIVKGNELIVHNIKEHKMV